MISVQEAVDNGIRLLDSAGPADWRKTIINAVRAKRFNILSIYHCVLGELYGNYILGRKRLCDDNFAEATLHGFTGYGYPLQKEWLKRVKEWRVQTETPK